MQQLKDLVKLRELRALTYEDEIKVIVDPMNKLKIEQKNVVNNISFS